MEDGLMFAVFALALLAVVVLMAATIRAAPRAMNHILAPFSVLVFGLPGLDANQQQNVVANAHLRAPVGDLTVLTATDVRTHRLVIHDTTDGSIQAAGDGAEDLLGWVEYGVADASDLAEWGNGEVKVDEDFGVGDVVHVSAGVGVHRKALLLDGESVTPGTKLVSAGSGKVRAYVAPVDATANDVGATIAAKSLQTAAPSGDDAFILVEALV